MPAEIIEKSPDIEYFDPKHKNKKVIKYLDFFFQNLDNIGTSSLGTAEIVWHIAQII